MGLKQILLNLSWDTLVNLPPTELLALLVFCFLAIAVASAIVAVVYSAATGK